MTGYTILWFGENSALNARFTIASLGSLSTGIAEEYGILAVALETCPGCLEEVHADDLETISFALQGHYSRRGNVAVCSDCYDSQVPCGSCGDTVNVESYRVADRLQEAIRDNGAARWDYLGASASCDDCGDLCQSCSDDHRYCEECDSTYCDDYSHDECGEEYRDGGSDLDLMGYSHKPYPIFHGDRSSGAPTFGVELETAYVNSGHVDAMNNLGEEYHSAWYAKADCTVRGAEFVSHPRTYASWVEHTADLEPIFARMIADGANNGGIDGNGIHVHVGRDAFSGRAHLARFALLIDNGHAWVTKLARRDNAEWSAFRTIAAGRRNAYRRTAHGHLFNLTSPHGGTGSRGAVNLQNSGTVEVRVWKQSLEVAHLLQAVGFVAAAVEYTRTLCVQEVMAGALTGESFAEWLSFRPEYAPVLSDLVSVFPNVEAPKYLEPTA